MITIKSLTKITAMAVGLLGMGLLTCEVPVSADEAPISAPGTAQDLVDIQVRDASEWPWAIGGDNGNFLENAPEEYRLYQSDNFFDSFEADTTPQRWQNQNTGEYQRESGKVPVVGF